MRYLLFLVLVGCGTTQQPSPDAADAAVTTGKTAYSCGSTVICDGAYYNVRGIHVCAGGQDEAIGLYPAALESYLAGPGPECAAFEIREPACSDLLTACE